MEIIDQVINRLGAIELFQDMKHMGWELVIFLAEWFLDDPVFDSW